MNNDALYVEDILFFLKKVASQGDISEILENIEIDIDIIPEDILLNHLKRRVIRTTYLHDIYSKISSLEKNILKFYNYDTDNLYQFVTLCGAMLYGKSIAKLIVKTQINDIRFLLGDQSYIFITQMAKTIALPEFNLKGDIKELFLSRGFAIYYQWILNQDEELVQYLLNEIPEHYLDFAQNFKIKSDFLLKLFKIVFEYTFKDT